MLAAYDRSQTWLMSDAIREMGNMISSQATGRHSHFRFLLSVVGTDIVGQFIFKMSKFEI